MTKITLGWRILVDTGSGERAVGIGFDETGLRFGTMLHGPEAPVWPRHKVAAQLAQVLRERSGYKVRLVRVVRWLP